jgi:hypothetical protein
VPSGAKHANLPIFYANPHCATAHFAKGSDFSPIVGNLRGWIQFGAGHCFALAFRKARAYLADQSRHCESKVRLAPPGTGTTLVLRAIRGRLRSLNGGYRADYRDC